MILFEPKSKRKQKYILAEEKTSGKTVQWFVICKSCSKIMPPFLWCWPMTSEADVGGTAVLVEPSTNISLYFVAVWWMAAEGQSDRMASEMEVCVKQRCGTEFLCAEKMAPGDIHWCLQNAYGHQTVNVSTVRWWWQWQWFTSTGADAYNCSAQALVHCKMHSKWWRLHWKVVVCSWEFALSISVIMLFVVVSMEINRRNFGVTYICIAVSPAGCLCAHPSVLHTWMSSICGPRYDFSCVVHFSSLFHCFCTYPVGFITIQWLVCAVVSHLLLNWVLCMCASAMKLHACSTSPCTFCSGTWESH